MTSFIACTRQCNSAKFFPGDTLVIPLPPICWMTLQYLFFNQSRYLCGIQLYFLSISENKSAFPLGSSSHIQSTSSSNMPGEEAPTTPIILCCPYYKKSAFYNISTVVSIENLALVLPLAGPVAFPSSALSSTLQKAIEEYTWTTDLSKQKKQQSLQQKKQQS